MPELPELQPITVASGTIFGTAAEGGIIPCGVAGAVDGSGCGTVYRFAP
jgi:hypothetical protein